MKFKRETSAGGIVFKKEGAKWLWLVVKLSRHTYWGFPKGHIGDKVKDEAPVEAAVREVKEEGGIEAVILNKKPITKEYTYRFKEYLIKKTVHYFLMQYKSGDIKNHDKEIQAIRFLPEEETLQTLSFKSDRDAFEKAKTLLDAQERSPALN